MARFCPFAQAERLQIPVVFVSPSAAWVALRYEATTVCPGRKRAAPPDALSHFGVDPTSGSSRMAMRAFIAGFFCNERANFGQQPAMRRSGTACGEFCLQMNDLARP